MAGIPRRRIARIELKTSLKGKKPAMIIIQGIYSR
jgi:hypothetical protein